MRHFTKRDYTVSQWSGGTTTQIAIYPPEALYADRDFLWRLSSATVDLEESDFTPLGDYQRWITVLEGAMTLTHDGGSSITLTPGQVHEFDGGSQTHSVGRCTDFNLMLRKGKCRGSIQAISLPTGSRQAITASESDTTIVFCCSGSGTVSEGDESITLAPLECVMLDHTASLAAEQDSLFILSEIQAEA